MSSKEDVSADSKQYQKDKDGNFYLIDRKPALLIPPYLRRNRHQ